MENNLPENIVFSKNVVEFVTVGVQYCSFLETFENSSSVQDISSKLTKLLPLLYLKGTLLPDIDVEYEIYPEVTVNEEDYNYIISRLFAVFKSDDTYLEVFLEDMKFSDTPISASISEDLTDLYQDIKNFVSIYEKGLEETMFEALFSCIENFKLYWGQKLVNVLRALHCLAYSNLSSPSDDVSDNIDFKW